MTADAKPRGRQFGPDPEDFDPYDGMSQAEIDDHIDRFLASQKTTPVSLRLPRWLIDQAKSEAARRHVPYQTLLRALIEVGLRRVGRKDS